MSEPGEVRPYGARGLGDGDPCHATFVAVQVIDGAPRNPMHLALSVLVTTRSAMTMHEGTRLACGRKYNRCLVQHTGTLEEVLATVTCKPCRATVKIGEGEATVTPAEGDK